jgi:peptidyl-prolyl cis-trans isomerase C
MRFFQILLLLLPCACLMGQTPPQGPKPVGVDGATFPFEIVKPAAATVDPQQVVLQVGQTKITAEQLDSLIDVYPPNMQVFARGPGKQQFAESIVRMLVLAEEGRKLKLNQTDKFKQQIQFSESNLLAQLANDAVKNSVKPSEAELRKYYDDHHCEYEEWHPRQLVVRVTGSPLPLRAGAKDLSEADALAKANELRARLAGGADFA